MIWGYVYIALIVGITLVVLWIGDRECRLAITTLLTGSALTLGALSAVSANGTDLRL